MSGTALLGSLLVMIIVIFVIVQVFGNGIGKSQDSLDMTACHYTEAVDGSKNFLDQCRCDNDEKNDPNAFVYTLRNSTWQTTGPEQVFDVAKAKTATHSFITEADYEAMANYLGELQSNANQPDLKLYLSERATQYTKEGKVLFTGLTPAFFCPRACAGKACDAKTTAGWQKCSEQDFRSEWFVLDEDRVPLRDCATPHDECTQLVREYCLQQEKKK